MDTGIDQVASTGTARPATPPLTPSVPAELNEMSVAVISVAGDPFLVAVADEVAERLRGLMGVTDLGDLDGMLFVYPEPTFGRFWMKNTVMPLDIAFFGGDGSLISVMQMDPCRADPCPRYGPDQVFRWALEAPEGALQHLRPGDRLEL